MKRPMALQRAIATARTHAKPRRSRECDDMNSMDDPRRANEATPLVARNGRRTEGGLRSVKYAVLTVCIGSLIAVATSRGAPSAFLGLGSQNGYPNAPVGVTASTFDETGAPAPYVSRTSGTPRVGAAPKPAPPAHVSEQAEAAGEILSLIHI